MRVGINVPEVLSASTLGAVGGILSFVNRERWVHLGRDAYLAHLAQIFDKQSAHPPPLLLVIILEVLLALFVLALFKGLAYFYEFVSGGSQSEKRAIVPPAKLIGDHSRPE